MATVREMKQQLDDAGNEVAGAARASVDDANGELHRLGAKLRSNGAQLEEELHDAGARLAQGARTFGDAAIEQVREHPMAAFGIAFVAGLVVSRMLRRR
ncbi:MAG: hypothetical protein ABJB02_07655 [Dokdonella sp.]